jgi:hypothetical protein
LREAIGEDSNRLRNVVFFNDPAAGQNVCPVTKLVAAFRAVLRLLGCVDLYVKGILGEYGEAPEVLALRAAIREVAGIDPSYPLAPQTISSTFLHRTTGRIYRLRRCKTLRRWAVREATPFCAT